MVENARNRTTWLILARGRKVRHWRLASALTCGVFALGLTGLGGAALGFSVAEPTVQLIATDNSSETNRIVDSYERRISALRAQIEQVTALQQSERRTMEARIAALLKRQKTLTERQGQLGSVLKRAASIDPSSVPAPAQRPIGANQEASAASALTPDALAAFLPSARKRPPTPFEVFETLDQSMTTIELTQRESLAALAEEAERKANTIATELRSLGFSPSANVGGPFIAADQPFDTSISALDAALDRLAAAKEAAVRAPIGHPVAGQTMTSRFGPRTDPFNRRRAMHSGIDFRARTGHPVLATGSGRIVKAGPNGGYGRFIEIDHGNGVTTRYAHLHRINVRVGQRVDAGQRIGSVGSTGRSTGPHLHYEVRKRGKAIDPLKFIRTGRSVARYL